MANDYFLKIDGIDGESQQTGHTKELEMDNWSFGETQSGVSATATGSASARCPCRISVSRNAWTWRVPS